MNSASMIAAGATVDDQLAQQFKDLGVKLIRMYPDVDHAGWNLSERLQAQLTKYGIRIFFYRLPYFSSNRLVKDVSDYWLSMGQDEARFVKALQSLPTLVLLSEEQKTDARDYFDGALYKEIEESFGITDEEYNGQGWSNMRPCPREAHQHDDTNPAFAWNSKLKIGRCFKCGDSMLAKDVAELRNIDWRKYLLKKPTNEREAKIENERSQRAGESLVASSLLHVGRGGLTDYSNTPAAEFMYSLDEALDDYELRLAGLKTSEFPPIKNPLTAIHGLGGEAKIISRPKMILIIGQSGGFKTSLQTWMVNQMLRDGHHGIVYSPEWAPEKNADRIVQQLGGLKMYEASLHERANYEMSMVQQGLMAKDDDSMFGVYASDEQLEKTRKALRFIRKKFRGKVVYMRQFGANALEVLAQIAEAARRMTESGFPPSFLVFDYAQMAIAPANMRATWSLQDTVTYTKALTTQLGLATFMLSQVRKDDSRGASDRQDLLKGDAGLGIRDDQFNLAMTLTRMPGYNLTPDGREVLNVKLLVTKNSGGAKADTDEDAIDLFVDKNSMNILMRNPDSKSGLQAVMELNEDDPDLQDDDY